MPYKKECMYCKNEILMSESLGRWFPLNLDNSPHMCREKKVAAKQQQPQKQEQPQLKNLLEAQLLLEGMDTRLKRVEKILFNDAK